MSYSDIKSTAWEYALVTLGAEMLNSVFSFYYVKLFLELYKVSEVAFYQSQVILMIWNILNDLNGYFHMNAQANCCASHHCSVLCRMVLCPAAFLLPWFPWRHYHKGDWLSGLQLVVSLCAFDSMLTWAQQAQCRLFAKTFSRYESQMQLIRVNHLATLVGCSSILFCSLLSQNMEMLPSFQATVVVIAFLATACLYSGTQHLESTSGPEENFAPKYNQDLLCTSAILAIRQIFSQRKFYLFLITNFFQVFHLTIFRNFVMIFANKLVPDQVLPQPMKSIMYGAGFICPQCLLLLGQSWLKKHGYYKIILISFYLEGAASLLMLLLGQEHSYCLAVYLTLMMVIIQASFCLFTLPLADMIDADLLKFNRQSPLCSMVFGVNALFTKPAQSLAPMAILSKLTQYRYGESNSSVGSSLEGEFIPTPGNWPHYIHRLLQLGLQVCPKSAGICQSAEPAPCTLPTCLGTRYGGVFPINQMVSCRLAQGLP